MSAQDWEWCGHAHHFIAADDCRYHMTTWVAGGRWMVSTVGDYRRDGERQPLGIGADSFFETMVFECDPDSRNEVEHPCVESWSEARCERYATAEAANEGHINLCWEFDRV